MTTSLPEPLVAALIKWARRYPQIDKIIVFGSRARGDARPDSDLDIALAFAIDVDSPLAELIDNKGAWCAKLTKLLGIVVKDMELAFDLEAGAHPYIENDGILVYQRRCNPAAPTAERNYPVNKP